MALTKVPSNLDSATATTQSQGDNSTNVATTAYVDTGLNNLIDSAPGNLNTLNELAAAMNDNASFFSTVLPLSGGTMTGNISHASDFTLDMGGDIILDADGGTIILKDGGTEKALISLDNSGYFDIYSSVQDSDIRLRGNNGGSLIDSLVLDMSEGGRATFNEDVVASGIYVGSRNASFDFYNNGTTYLNGTTYVDDVLLITGSDAEIRIGDGFRLDPNSSGRIGMNRNPANGNATASSSLQRIQINGPVVGGDYLDIQNYNSSGTYKGSLRLYDGNVYINGSNDMRIKLGDSGVAGVSTSNNTVHIRGDNDTLKLNAAANGHIIFEEDGSERMRIRTGGNVGIGGNATPLQALEVYRNSSSGSQGGYAAISLRNDHSSGYMACQFHEGSTLRGDILFQNGVDDMQFRVGGGGTERMRITQTGGVLVGTTASQLYDSQSATGVVLHDDSSYASCGAHMEVANSADSGWAPVYLQRFSWNSGDDSRWMQFAVNGGSDVGTISYDGTNFSIANSSDYRLKENIVDYTGGLAKINALQVRSFNKKEGVSKDITQQGFIAHELAEHIPNAVIGEKDATRVDEQGNNVPDYQQVTREALVPYLVSAIQEQQTIIEDLKARIETLEG